MDRRDRRVVPPSVGEEVDEELAFHVEMRVRELVAEGWTEERARAEAIRRFGDLERVKSNCRTLGRGREGRMQRRRWWDELRQDVAWSIRQYRREPGFAAVASLTLAVAIGATAAVFSVVDGVLLRPLPYPEPDRLAAIWTRYLPPSGFDIPRFDISGPEVLDYRDATEAFETVGIWDAGAVALTGDEGDAERVSVGYFSREMFDALGVRPLHGRVFSEEEDRPDAGLATVLGHDLWVTRYGSDPSVVGRSILMNGRSVEVVGVMPEGFAFPDYARAWLPLGLDRTNEGDRGGHGYGALGRLAPGVTLAEARAELEGLNAGWAEDHEHNVGHFLFVQDLKADLLQDSPRTLYLLLGAVGLVLLIACANVANLLLARAERRQSEVGVRTALGAGQGRIVRQLLTESLVLAGVAGVLGLMLAWGATPALLALDPTALPRLEAVGVTPTVVGFTLVAVLATALLFGTVPALVAGRRAMTSIASAAARSAGSRGGSLLRRGLVAGEVALSVVVVVLAGLMGRTLGSLSATDPGFRAERVLTFRLSLPSASYPEPERTPAAFGELTDRLMAVPGVTSAATTSVLPFAGYFSRWDFQLDDRPPRQDGDRAWNARVAIVSADYFQTLGIPILEGRGFQPSDGPDGELVGVVSEGMAETYWPGRSAVGKRWGYRKQNDDGDVYVNWIRVVGVAREQYVARVDEEVVPQVYLLHSQAGIAGYDWPRTMSVALRTAVDPTSLVPAVRSALRELDPELPLSSVETLEQAVDAALAEPRLATSLLGTFGALALVLAAVGIYGVISYSVAGRTREIGVRVALGAERSHVIRMIVGEGARPLALGIVGGLALAWWAGSLIESLLFGVTPTDPLTFALLPAALLAVGVTASLVPALRATAVAPTEALREE